MGAREIGRFYEHVVRTEAAPVDQLENASTALQFLYKEVLQRDVGEIPMPSSTADGSLAVVGLTVATAAGILQLTGREERNRKLHGTKGLRLGRDESLTRLRLLVGRLQQRVTHICNSFLQQLRSGWPPIL
jgi:hypothetical protein